MRFALALVAILVAACIAGTVLPQGNAGSACLRHHTEAASRLGWLRALGFTDVFHSFWFVGLLGLLALSLVTCGVSQIRALRRQPAAARGRGISALLVHISLVAILAGGLIRGIWGQKGSLQLCEGESAAAFRTAAGVIRLPFEIRLERFEIEVDNESHARAERSIRNYRSTLAISEGGRVVKEGSLAVNAPLSYGGYTFYQSGYDPADTTWTSLLVVRDPGVPLVFAGFGILIVGLFLGLYVWPKETATDAIGGMT